MDRTLRDHWYPIILDYYRQGYRATEIWNRIEGRGLTYEEFRSIYDFL